MKVVFGFLTGVVFALTGCDKAEVNNIAEEIVETVVLEPAVKMYGERGAENSWPVIGDASEDVDENITAKNYYIVIDGSGSMLESDCTDGESKIDVARRSLFKFFTALPQGSNVGIYIFDKVGTRERLSLGKHGVDTIMEKVNDIVPGRLTPLTAAVIDSMDALSDQAKKQLGYGEYHLVIVTDGAANNIYSLDSAVDDLLFSSPIVLHTVGFCIKGSHTLNQPGYTIYKAANDQDALIEGLESVLAESADFQSDTFSGGI